MKTIVNQQSFTHYKEVIEMLQEVEEIFQRLKKIEKFEGISSSDKSTRKSSLGGKIYASASEEQQRQIESYRDIHTDAIRLQRVESEGMARLQRAEAENEVMAPDLLDAVDSLHKLANQTPNNEATVGKRKCANIELQDTANEIAVPKRQRANSVQQQS